VSNADLVMAKTLGWLQFGAGKACKSLACEALAGFASARPAWPRRHPCDLQGVALESECSRSHSKQGAFLVTTVGLQFGLPFAAPPSYSTPSSGGDSRGAGRHHNSTI
jgi:hypothetical protein